MEFLLTGEELVKGASYIGAALSMGLGAVGAAMGIGTAAVGALSALARRPSLQSDSIRTMFIGQAVAESTAVYALVVAMLLLFTVGGGNTDAVHGSDWVNAIGIISAGLTMGLGAIGAGYGIGLASRAAIDGMTQRPEARGALMRTMFLGMAITESPAIYALVIAMLLIFVEGRVPHEVGFFSSHIVDMARLLGAGIAMGAGAIGAALGIGAAAAGALTSIARQPAKQGSLVRTMFLSMAITESPAIYALVVSTILLFVFAPGPDLLRAIEAFDLVTIGQYLGGAIAIGFGTIGAGVGLGYAGSAALQGISRNPGKESSLVRTMFLSMAITESPAIYALVISLILLFVPLVSAETLSWGAGWAEMAKLLGGGLAIGLGTIGAGAGVGIAGVGGLLAISRQPKKEGSILRTMFIGMGVTESPTIYALVVSLILLFVVDINASATLGEGLVEMAKFLGAGIAMGAGAIGPGLGIGLVTRDALTGIAKQPKEEGALVRTMFLGMAVTESTAIYALVVSLILLFALQT